LRGEVLELVVGLGVVVHHALTEGLDIRIGALGGRDLAELDLQHAALGGIGEELAVGRTEGRGAGRGGGGGLLLGGGGGARRGALGEGRSQRQKTERKGRDDCFLHDAYISLKCVEHPVLGESARGGLARPAWG